MFRARAVLALSLPAVCFCPPASSQCINAPEVKKLTDRYSDPALRTLPEAERSAAQRKILDAALAQYPTNQYVLERQLDWFDDNTSKGQDDAIAYFAALRQKYPNSPEVTAEYADALHNRDSAKALELLDAAENTNPENSFIHYKLFTAFNGKLRGTPRLMEEIESYLKLCPSPNNGSAYRAMTTVATPEQMAHYAALLRTRLASEPGPPNQQLWQALWDLEFKAAPPAEHAALRRRIGSDLARFEPLPAPDGVSWLTFLKQGYALLGDKTAQARIDARIVKEFPDTLEAERIVTAAWREQHPYPRNGGKAQLDAYYRAAAPVFAAWSTRWHDTMLLMEQFTAVAALDESKPEELTALARKYVAAYHANPNDFYGANPVEFDVADTLIRKKALLPEIPSWMDEGFRRENERPSRLLGRTRSEMNPEMLKRADTQIASMRIERARILLDYYDALGQPQKGRGVEDQIAGVVPPDDRLKPALYEVLAHAAEMDGRHLDALMYLKAARDLGGKPARGGATDAAELDAKIDALWKDLGGRASTESLFTGKVKLAPVSLAAWEVPKNPIPMFTVQDLSGKTWKLSELAGKAVLINLWATWCGPCREEHPALQKLYEKWKDRSDVALLSINLDTETGLAQPYMAEHSYTFPALLGKSVVDAVLGTEGFGIPQNWFVAPGGKLTAIQVGYGADPDWEKTMTSKIDELLKSK